MSLGVVKFFKHDRGWGAISTAELPTHQDVWVGFAAIDSAGYASFTAGDIVEFDYEAAHQDGFEFRATRARRIGHASEPDLGRAPDGSVAFLNRDVLLDAAARADGAETLADDR